jgi:predicted N-acetyltransferase YhbS
MTSSLDVIAMAEAEVAPLAAKRRDVGAACQAAVAVASPTRRQRIGLDLANAARFELRAKT